MSSEAMKWARRNRFGTLALQSLVNAIAARVDQKGATWASQDTLSDDIGCVPRHVRNLLPILEGLEVISRTPRSAGRHGRITDILELNLHRSFDISRADVRAIKTKIECARALKRLARAEAKSSNRNPLGVPTGTSVPGNTKGTTYPSQGEHPASQNLTLSPKRPGNGFSRSPYLDQEEPE